MSGDSINLFLFASDFPHETSSHKGGGGMVLDVSQGSGCEYKCPKLNGSVEDAKASYISFIFYRQLDPQLSEVQWRFPRQSHIYIIFSSDFSIVQHEKKE